MTPITRNDPESWLRLVWEHLQLAHESIEYNSGHDDEWDDVCTAMAWIAEELGVEYPHPE